MDRLLEIILASYVKAGNLHVTTAAGRKFALGDGTGRRVAVRFTSATAQLGFLLDPELKLGEAFIDGTVVVEQGTIADVVDLAFSQGHCGKSPWWVKPQWLARYLWRHLQQFNPRRESRRNAAYHYDLDGRLYSLFLDSDRQYSCAYFEFAGQPLDDAQLAKKRHVAAKLLIQPQDRVLDIGSGWGGLGLYLADICGAEVDGVTLSNEQLEFSRNLAAEWHLGQQVRFSLIDYRDIMGIFDRIVSVGMFEHVGVDYYGAYFQKCATLLEEDGVMLLHSIGRSEGPGITNPWIAKYVFPGGYIPALSEVLPAIERAGLLVTDIEILRVHYADTLKAWRERFLARREEVERVYDERFCRTWEFYLASSEMAFRDAGMMVFQIQMAKRGDAVPVTRNYIAGAETRLRAIEAKRRPGLRLAGE